VQILDGGRIPVVSAAASAGLREFVTRIVDLDLRGVVDAACAFAVCRAGEDWLRITASPCGVTQESPVCAPVTD
jgi:hypothetical protein